ncbi:tRNA lysidine(34) synthetase TilS, partial [Flavobacteriaceae bacterium]|nr:tRNA lysidine(34) synthetase TilS [Flavobacteriaceae bacterium]
MIFDFKDKILSIFPIIPNKIAVAVSGGVDSMALLFLLKEVVPNFSEVIFPITIDHKLRSESTSEAKEISSYLSKIFPNHTVLTSKFLKSPTANIEHIARNMRYKLLLEFCQKHQIEHLFVGHHQEDLAENFLIRLFRGSGIDGLSATELVTNIRNIKIIRPLLDFTKDELLGFLQEHTITYFPDYSNDEEKYLRNKIRNFLSSLKESNLINQRIALASRSILESKKIIEDDMVNQAKEIFNFNEIGSIALNLENFKFLPEQKALRYLAWILIEIGGNEYKPRLNKLGKLYQAI